MIVRKIRPEEFKRIQQFCSLAFEYAMDEPNLSAADTLEKIMKEPESRQDLFWQSQWAAFEDDDRTMMSTFTAIPYHANFDGHSVKMMGIGGVATLPEFRRRGGVRGCFEHALPDMYAQGYALSYLYPFSTAFYRKFGYELGCERNLWKIRLSAVPKFEVDGTFHLLEPEKNLKADIRQVYDAFASRYNCMTLDEDIEYLWVDKANPFRDKEYTYVYRAADGTPKGIVSYKPIMDEGDRALDCSRHFWFADVEGFKALLVLLCRLQADHSHILVNLPDDVKLDALVPEWSFDNLKRNRYCHGMVRVIDAVQVLKLAKMQGSGELVIELSDHQIEQNNGRFHVVFENGVTLSVERTENEADVSMPITEFSRLICGKHEVSEWAWLPEVKCFCDPQKAAKVFYAKPMFITRYF